MTRWQKDLDSQFLLPEGFRSFSRSGEDINIDENWDEKIELYRKELEEKENSRKELSKKNNNEESSWELHDLCKDYLEKNSSDWARRKEIREKENAKKERLAKA